MKIEEHLTQIKNRMAIGERHEPERMLMDLIAQMGPSERADWRPDIVRIADEFQKKRRRNVMDLLDNGEISGIDLHGRESCAAAPLESASVAEVKKRLIEFRQALDDLGERHIFQWSTFYRDCFDAHLDRFLPSMGSTSPDGVVEAVTESLAAHTFSIFRQGYDHVLQNRGHGVAISKSIAGLSQFLAVLLDYYSARASNVLTYDATIALRLLFSATVSGILDGYSRIEFGGDKGDHLLSRFQRQWVQHVAFLTPQHAEAVIGCLAPGPLASGLKLSALPLLDALQRCFGDERRNEDYWPLPVLGQYSWHERRLDIGIRPPRNATSQRLIEVRAFLEEGFVSRTDLDHALGQQVTLVIAPLRPDIKSIVNDHERLREIVVTADRPQAGPEKASRQSREFTASRAFKVLDESLYALRSKLKASSPITYNFAREFPLHQPGRAQAFHVTRTSVRDLLRTFERRNGVRLWCSIRRSGKTTACFDLETTTGDSVIVSQTCGTPPNEIAAAFYAGVREAVGTGQILANTFVRDIVGECASVEIDGKRTVLIIDEYETLFGLLKSAVERKNAIRYTVVQPILDQLAAFAQDNLLVFLGQQPDAYFILMDQNQLAPYVTQDSFPLFEHISGTGTGEFSKLVDKMLLARIECTAEFLDALHLETAGHPYLTANVLTEFVDWLIDKQRPQSGLRLQQEDFSNFEQERLGVNGILMSPEYDFFRQAASSALSEQGYRDNPWLFATYWTLRQIHAENSGAFSISRTDFKDLVSRIPVPKGGNLPECSELLRTASQANFLSHDDRDVKILIRTLGRIVAAVRPEVA